MDTAADLGNMDLMISVDTFAAPSRRSIESPSLAIASTCGRLALDARS
jgi:hypothetical protein